MSDVDGSLTSRLNRGFVEHEPDTRALVIEELYPELLAIAGRMKGRIWTGSAPQTIELLSEALVRLAGIQKRWLDRQHFFATFAKAVRCARVDEARRSRCEPLLQDDDLVAGPGDELSIRTLDLDAALERIEQEQPLAAQVVSMRYFLGMELEAIAADLGVPLIRVRRLHDLSKRRLAALLRRYQEPG